MNRLMAAGVVVVALLFLLFNSFFTVREDQQALVLQFGEVKQVVREPGLNFKMPILQNVVYYSKKVLDFDADKQQIIAGDQKRLSIDTFARYRIVDPLKFYQTVLNERRMEDTLGSIVNNSVRTALAQAPLDKIVSSQRAELMRRIRTAVGEDSKVFGIEIVDVRIMRADLPQENSQAIFARMQSERVREAKQHRAEGEQDAQTIRSEAERDRTILIAEAQRQAQFLRGDGDGEAALIFADAFNKDPKFFDLYRSLQAYREALRSGETTMLLSPDSDFFRFFGDITGGVEGAKR